MKKIISTILILAITFAVLFIPYSLVSVFMDARFIISGLIAALAISIIVALSTLNKVAR
jgi:hypothetical protein